MFPGRALPGTTEGGFSLIELLCALVLFAIVTLGVANSTLQATRSNRDSQRKAVAVNLGHQVLECAKAQYQAGRPISLRTGTQHNAGVDCNPATTFADFTLSNVTVDTATWTGLTRIVVTISWTSPMPDQITLDTLVDT